MNTSTTECDTRLSATELPELAPIEWLVVMGLLLSFSVGDLVCPASAQEQATVADTNINPVIDRWMAGEASFMELLEQSRLVYLLDVLPDSEVLAPNPDLWLPAMGRVRRIEHLDGSIELREQPPPAWMMKRLFYAESLFVAEEFDIALDEYRAVWREAPEYVAILTLMGDALYVMGRYDSAAAYFRASIDSNYADYHAHWFLADALWHLGDTAAALEEFTLAHVLNVSHNLVRVRLMQLLDLVGRPWQHWSFQPRYRIVAAADTIHVYLAAGWIAYGLTKAALLHEPGLLEKVTAGLLAENAKRTDVERIAINYWIDSPDSDSTLASRVRRVRDDGALAAMVWYEMFAHDTPWAIWGLPRPTIQALAQYVNRYH